MIVEAIWSGLVQVISAVLDWLPDWTVPLVFSGDQPGSLRFYAAQAGQWLRPFQHWVPITLLLQMALLYIGAYLAMLGAHVSLWIYKRLRGG